MKGEETLPLEDGKVKRALSVMDKLLEISLTYSTNIVPIINNNHCLNCHSASSPPTGISLGTYSQVMIYVDAGHANSSTLYFEVTMASPLMPEGFSSLSAADLMTLQNWINSGAAP